MTYPPPQPQPPPPVAPAVPGQPQHARGGRGGWGKVLGVALAIGLVVAVLTGVGGFVGARGLTGADGTTRCGDGNLCFTAIEPDALIGLLSDQGYVCGESSVVSCDLVTGSARYEVDMGRGSDGDRVRWYEVSVSYGNGVPLPGKGAEFLAYFAALPVDDDAGVAAEAREWVATHQEFSQEGALSETIGGFDYRLVHRQHRSDLTVSLRVEAGESWL